MALWKNKGENEKPGKYDLEKLEEKRIKLKEEAETYIEKLNETKGITVKVEGLCFDIKHDYLFFADDGNYVFTYKYDKNDCIFSTTAFDMEERIELYEKSFEHYEKILETKPYYLKKSEYLGTDLPVDYQAQKSDAYAAELIYPTGHIKFALKSNINNQDNVVVTIRDLKQDLSILGNLKQTLRLKNFYNILDIPEDSFQVTIVNGDGFCHEDTYFIFREHGYLLFACLNNDSYYGKHNVTIIKEKLDNILYYKSEGSIRYEQQISGGGGMGINYGSAIIGGLLFGDAGAIIGSRRNEEISDIKSKTITHDDRIVTFVIRKENRIFQIGMQATDELALDWLIPEKQYDYVIQKRREKFEAMENE